MCAELRDVDNRHVHSHVSDLRVRWTLAVAEHRLCRDLTDREIHILKILHRVGKLRFRRRGGVISFILMKKFTRRALERAARE